VFTGGKGQRYVLVMVGLPARGKTYTARKLAGYLSWLGYPTRVFNVGEHRRAKLGARQTADFFDPSNADAERLRHEVATATLEEALTWLQGDARVAIFDATNSSCERRAEIRRRCNASGLGVVFIEIVNHEQNVIEANVRETKLSSPDYAGMDPEEAVADFRARIAHYEQVYETLGEDEGSFLKIIDRGRRVVMNEIDGYLPARIVFFLTNLQVTSRPLWMTRHGESIYNVKGLIGGDSPLSPGGQQYALRLARHVDEVFGPGSQLEVWASTLVRTVQTAQPLGRDVSEWRSLDEIDAGICDGMSYKEIARLMPREFEGRKQDKLRYRYPRGESYEDVIQRVDRVIIEAERQRTPVLIIAHQAVLRALYSYFQGLPVDRTPYVPIPLHTVIKLTPKAYGCDEERVDLGPEAVTASSST
jgi:broad specificity phosphatase PhoE/predicted kinase